MPMRDFSPQRDMRTSCKDASNIAANFLEQKGFLLSYNYIYYAYHGVCIK